MIDVGSLLHLANQFVKITDPESGTPKRRHMHTPRHVSTCTLADAASVHQHACIHAQRQDVHPCIHASMDEHMHEFTYAHTNPDRRHAQKQALAQLTEELYCTARQCTRIMRITTCCKHNSNAKTATTTHNNNNNNNNDNNNNNELGVFQKLLLLHAHQSSAAVVKRTLTSAPSPLDS
jgi:hypothetical protein